MFRVFRAAPHRFQAQPWIPSAAGAGANDLTGEYPGLRDEISGAISDENHDVRLANLRPEKPGVAVLGVVARRHEALAVEAVVRSHEQRTEAPE